MNHFLAGFIGGLALNWIVRQLLSKRHCSSGLCLGANQITKAEWEAMRTPPPQPLTADLIRYWRWQDEQVRQALEEGTNPPPGEAP